MKYENRFCLTGTVNSFSSTVRYFKDNNTPFYEFYIKTYEIVGDKTYKIRSIINELPVTIVGNYAVLIRPYLTIGAQVTVEGYIKSRLKPIPLIPSQDMPGKKDFILHFLGMHLVATKIYFTDNSEIKSGQY